MAGRVDTGERGTSKRRGGLALAVRTEAVIRAPSRGAKLGQGQVGSTRPTARWTEARPPGSDVALGDASASGVGRRVLTTDPAPAPVCAEIPGHTPSPSTRPSLTAHTL